PVGPPDDPARDDDQENGQNRSHNCIIFAHRYRAFRIAFRGWRDGKPETLSDGTKLWPANADAVVFEKCLKIGQVGGGISDLAGKFFAGTAEMGECAGGFADVPFHRMKSVT